ncbi:MAG: BlaI/MecI/CopY family transcriptional regulator [Planctomycetaceae bacterium]|nr:BlaI/MecI/CopY family transcriptional regulator [Planctomycetaceae bacterium]
MDVIWGEPQVTVQDVVDRLDRNLAYTTVMTTVRILESKGIIERCGKAGRAYLYRSVVSRDLVRRSMTKDLTGSLFGGSVKSLMLSLLGSQSMSQNDIAELKAAIDSLESDQ